MTTDPWEPDDLTWCERAQARVPVLVVLSDWRYLWGRPVWRPSDIELAMAAGEQAAGPDWRESPEGRAAFSEVTAATVVWLPWWKGRKRLGFGAGARVVLGLLVVLTAALAVAIAAGGDVTPNGMFGRWEPLGHESSLHHHHQRDHDGPGV